MSDIKADNRDVSFIKLKDETFLAISCDSSGAIGSKKNDIIKVPPYVVGRCATRVAMMELLAVGATPRALTAAICSEPEPTGEGMLSGVYDELEYIDRMLPITISTEKNIPTSQTGLGITAIGIVEKSQIRINKTQTGDKLYCIGIPKVGNEVSLDDPEIADITTVKKLCKIPYLHDIIPVGSKGIKGEVDMLTSFLGLSITWIDDIKLDISKTAGPVTCVLATSPEILKLDVKQPINFLGTFA